MADGLRRATAGRELVSEVTVTFGLGKGNNPQRFVSWLRTECEIAMDGDGDLQVEILTPVVISLLRVEGL